MLQRRERSRRSPRRARKPWSAGERARALGAMPGMRSSTIARTLCVVPRRDLLRPVLLEAPAASCARGQRCEARRRRPREALIPSRRVGRTLSPSDRRVRHVRPRTRRDADEPVVACSCTRPGSRPPPTGSGKGQVLDKSGLRRLPAWSPGGVPRTLSVPLRMWAPAESEARVWAMGWRPLERLPGAHRARLLCPALAPS